MSFGEESFFKGVSGFIIMGVEDRTWVAYLFRKFDVFWEESSDFEPGLGDDYCYFDVVLWESASYFALSFLYYSLFDIWD